MKLDNIDRKILRELQNNGKLANTELAKKVNLSPSPCLTRVKRLEAEGTIRQYVALLDPQQLDLRLNVFVFISLKAQSRQALKDFEARVCAYDEVMECYLMTGDADYLIRLAMTDMESLERFIVENLSPMPEIEKIRSSFALKQVRYKTALPLR
ncbi:MAG: Lrp/AsnC family transcriptional regulator [Zhongshania sp.]|uniref:Lrp/AsnC family transcriptional regulator n=1 Tax=Zhongshania sp. TaxID=1971902 RepID=UPI0026292F61|nr:Lrp/AsnC family transcriptional regulator [Zhongshania sp.]MDF1691469.1 Lrp/AsnC family transcriptional regulator [Zhongshania sp.]